MNFWTDYPIAELGDAPGVQAPVRLCKPVAYDGNKYCRVEVEGVVVAFKAGYIYTEEGRSGEVPTISRRALGALPNVYPA